MKKKFSRIAGATLGLTLLFSTNAYAEWQQVDINWQFVNADGTYAKDGWQWINEKCYYFTPEGYCLINTTTPDGYEVDGSGAWTINGVVQTQPYQPVKGWNDVNGVWKYYTGYKYVTSDWKKIEKARYYFDENGNMVEGFQYIDGDQYYFNDDGKLQTESFTMDGMYYIIEEKGIISDEVDEFNWLTDNYEDPDDDYYDNSDNNNSNDNSGKDHSDKTFEADESSIAYEIFEIVNRERRNADKDELEWDDALAACAQERANEIAEEYSHTRPDGTRCFTILGEGGISYSSAGENIAMGQGTPEAVMTAWMNSSGHKANILDSSFGRIGVGCAYIDGIYHWVQLFTD